MNHPDHLGVVSDRAHIARDDCKLCTLIARYKVLFVFSRGPIDNSSTALSESLRGPDKRMVTIKTEIGDPASSTVVPIPPRGVVSVGQVLCVGTPRMHGSCLRRRDTLVFGTAD